jgi:death-on-curing protein
MADIIFLTLAEVIDIHTDQIERYGGSPGVRDMNLLSSAVAMPSASFGSDYLHADICEMAAAYAFHIAQNHPFIDGNNGLPLRLLWYSWK